MYVIWPDEQTLDANALPAAIACNIAKDSDMLRAVRSASRYVEAGIRTSPDLGEGSGPLNHFHSIQVLPFSRCVPLLPFDSCGEISRSRSLTTHSGNFIDYLLERDDVIPAWHDYTHHDFVERMGNGTLPVESYKRYMIQDYLYLV